MTNRLDVGAADSWTRGEDPDADEVSFDRFCRETYPVMVRALSLALDNRDLGQEAAAEAFARAWQRWTTVAEMDNPSGWVYRTGLNWGRSLRRRRRREVLGPLTGAREGIADAATGDPALAKAIGRLDPKYRVVIIAKFYLDWSEAEIAQALKIAPGTVKSRLSRALHRLSTTKGIDE